MKKFKYSFILVFILLFNIKDLTYAQGDIGVGNLRNFYTKHDYIDLKGVTDKNLPIANQLEFSTGTNDLISESNNWDEISKFKGRNWIFLALIIMVLVNLNTCLEGPLYQDNT